MRRWPECFREGERALSYLSPQWRGKKVRVKFKDRGGFSGVLREYDEGGLVLKVESRQAGEDPRIIFVPWGSAKYVEALEELKQQSRSTKVR
jgi:hypothetical protein